MICLYYKYWQKPFLPVEALHDLAQTERVSNHCEVQLGSLQAGPSDIQPSDMAAEAEKVQFCPDVLFGETGGLEY